MTITETRQVLNPAPSRPALVELLAQAARKRISDETLTEQRISFAYGNAMSNTRITKDGVRKAARRQRLIIETP